jgi:hypothetical protein
MLVSTFELLVKPIAPAGSGPAPVARTVVQGYFLTIANPNNFSVGLRLQFTATTPGLNVLDTVTILDVTGANLFGDITPVPADPKRSTFNLSIPANDTALVTLLPDITKPELLAAKSLEIRGYVEIFATSPFAPTKFDLLLTPEHRGTFLPNDLAAPNPDFDQLAYALPTANGGNLFTLTGPPKISKELKPEIKEKIEIKEKAEIKDIKEIENKVSDKAPAETPELPVQTADIQRILGLMAERIDDLGQRIEMGQAFISPQERPTVGEQVVNESRNVG